MNTQRTACPTCDIICARQPRRAGLAMHFTIESGVHNERNDDVTFLVSINEQSIPQEGYSLEADSFFRAVTTSHATIIFVGSCGDKGCCAIGLSSHVTNKNWSWNDHAISWTEAYAGAKHILCEIEAGRYECSNEELKLYKDALSKMEKYAL